MCVVHFILESITKNLYNELQSKEGEIAEIKEYIVEKFEEINSSKQNKIDINKVSSLFYFIYFIKYFLNRGVTFIILFFFTKLLLFGFRDYNLCYFSKIV